MRSSREPSKQAVYRAARTFVDSCIRGDGSLFLPDRAAWSADVLQDLWERFNNSPDESTSTFTEKFKRQLTGAPTPTIQLAAEVIYVHFLIAHDVGIATKRALIDEVCSWASELITVPVDLEQALDGGICSTGVAFKTYRPNQLWFIIDAARTLKAQPAADRDALLSDPWRFKRFIEAVPQKAAYVQRQALLHLIYPEVFEDSVSRSNKARIINTFAPSISVDVPSDPDEALAVIRQHLAAQHGDDFSFYDPGFVEQWKPTPTPASDEGEARAHKHAWLIRGTEAGVSLVPDWLAGGYCSIGWHEVGEVPTDIDRLGLIERLRATYPDAADGALSNWASSILRFLQNFAPGDVVLAPRGDDLYLGVVEGPIEYLIGERPHPWRRAVDWSNTDDPISRRTISASLFSKLRTLLTISDLSDVLPELEALLSPAGAPRDQPDSDHIEVRALLSRVLALQSEYDSRNTPEMEERGQLIRQAIPQLLADLFRDRPLTEIDDLRFEGRDGTGRKTRIPWVRGYSASRSPRATEGWYAVYLFSVDGRTLYLSLNQGTTIFEGGGFRPRDAEDIEQRIAWAREELVATLANREDLSTDLALGGVKGGLGEGYEAGNVACIAYESLDLPSDQQLLDDLQSVLSLVGKLYSGEEANFESAPADPRAWLSDTTLLTEATLEDILASLEDRSPQIVLAGPPGTGKTWIALALARYLASDFAASPKRIRTVQFHPSYGYEEFVEGLRPVPSAEGGIEFARVDGAVLDLVDRMIADPRRHVMVIDEMNRANLPRVFGELMFLLEYRDTPIDLLYSKGFQLPNELLFIATMNTADRSIRSVDVALRRRFDFFDVMPDVESLRRFYATAGNENSVGEGLFEGLERLNADLTEALDRHHTIGQTFFMVTHLTAEHLFRVWRRQLAPLIEEYFFDQPDVAATFSPDKYWPSLGSS